MPYDAEGLDDASTDALLAFFREAAAEVGDGHAAVLDSQRTLAAGYRKLARGVESLTDRLTLGSVPQPSRPGTDERPAPPTGLDDRDMAIADALRDGIMVKQIARRLGVSERTVRERIARMRKTAGAATMFELGAEAVARGWVSSDTAPEA